MRGQINNFNLLIITNALAKGGAEKLIEVTIPYFIKNDVQVTLLLLDKKKSYDGYIETVEREKVKVIDLQSHNLKSPRNIFKIKNILVSNHFDVVHVHLFPALYWASIAYKMLPAKKKKAIKLVYTEHSNHNKRRNSPALKFIEKKIYNSYSKIIAITNEVKIKLDKWIGNHNKTIVVNNGVDIRHVQSIRPYTSPELITQFHIKESNVRFLLMAASFRYPKDQSTVLNALHLLPGNYHLLLAGEGATKTMVEELAGKLGVENRVHFLGFRKDVLKLMKSVDINVLSSDYEGLSGVTLEALASGKPFLGSDVPGINDIVPDGRFLFEKGNSADLASKINSIIQDQHKSQSMAAVGLEFVRQYDIPVMIENHLKLYHQIMAANENKKYC